jgi:hypothetical protein
MGGMGGHVSDSVVTREDIFVCLTKMLSRKRREDEDVLAHHVDLGGG